METKIKKIDQEQLLYGIANKKGMSNNNLFAKFMLLAFPKEYNENYLSEWANRFMSGNVTSYMDYERTLIYIRLITKNMEDMSIESIQYPLKDVVEIVKDHKN